MTAKARVSMMLAVTAMLVLTAMVSSASAESASAARGCSANYRLGSTYITKLSTRRASCGTARRVVRAFHACRKRNGGADGRCRRAAGYRCAESRSGIRTQYNARVTCRRGGKRVYHRYTQNT